ncbi:MAG: hypothetical protein COT73_01465, partial [Bdellovibrio sp. CG10_big_fil_rev_8_21_14_0_10_47_8]
EALAEFSLALDALGDAQSCNATQCDEIRRRVRQFVVTWNQSEKKQPSADLLRAYQEYTQHFPNDIDMQIFAAQLCVERKELALAAGYYDRAMKLLISSKEAPEKLDNVLLAQIENAESLKDESLMKNAYENYLRYSPKKNQAFHVRYQLARGEYEKGKYEIAAPKLRTLALDSSGEAKVRKQAADLSLDALVLLKDDQRLHAWATEYSATFKENRSEFSQIAQKTVLSKVALEASSNQELAYQELAKFQVDQASPEDRIKYYKNKMILAEKLNRYTDAQSAADQLLKQPNLSTDDQELAWGKKARIAELRLDFPSAILATEKLQKAYAPEDKALKVALFSELAGQSAQEAYLQYLKISKDEKNKQLVAAELVRKSKSPSKDIETLKSHLANNPALLAQLYAEILARDYSPSLAKKVLRDQQLRDTSAGKLLARVQFLTEFSEVTAQVQQSKMDSSNDRKLASSIKSRGSLLQRLEVRTKDAIESGDWTCQLVSIDALAKESDRFYQDLISAPMPAGLTAEEEQQYLNLLAGQAAPFQAKATEAKSKVDQFWKDSTWLQSLKTAWEEKPLRRLLKVETEALRAIAPNEEQAQILALTTTTTTDRVAASPRPDAKEISKAREKVYLEPTNRAALEMLLSLEKQSENKPMIQYLQTRLETLNKGVL